MSTKVKLRTKSRPPVSTRINLRVQPKTKAFLVRAARLQQMKLTEFMIKSAQLAAEVALADRTRFVLPTEKWREFNVALHSPPASSSDPAEAIQGALGIWQHMTCGGA